MKDIHDVAALVRKAFERIAHEEHWRDDLQGLCGRAAVQVWLEADACGIPLRLVAGNCHAFCTTHDDEIVDVTATQFNHHRGCPPDGYGAVEVGYDHGDELPWWYEEEACWDSVSEWLSESEDDLYYARSAWQDDRAAVLELKKELESAPILELFAGEGAVDGR